MRAVSLAEQVRAFKRGKTTNLAERHRTKHLVSLGVAGADDAGRMGRLETASVSRFWYVDARASISTNGARAVAK